MSINTDKVRSIIGDIAAVIGEQKQYLSDLDQAIGDGDHGFNMARGFDAVMQKFKDTPGTDIGEVLKTTAMTLISNVGGASGPLYGTLFLKAAGLAKGVTELDLAGFVPLLKEGILGFSTGERRNLAKRPCSTCCSPCWAPWKKTAPQVFPAKRPLPTRRSLPPNVWKKQRTSSPKKGGHRT